MRYSKSNLVLQLVILIIILIISCKVSKGQSVSFSPTSSKIWGKTPEMMKGQVTYKQFSVVALKFNNPIVAHNTEGDYIGYGEGWYFGLFWEPLQYSYKRFTIKGGAGLFNRKMPIDTGSILNFTAKFSYKINENVSLQYSHISNGFGLQNQINPGIDNFSLKINIGEIL